MGKNRARGERVAWAAGLTFALTAALLMLPPIGAAHVSALPTGATRHAAVAAGPSTKAQTTCAAGTNPEFVAYNPVTKWYYVTDVVSGQISVYKATCTIVGTIALPTGSQPRGVAYSPSTNRIYVADFALDQLYVITKLAIKQTLTDPSFDGPFAIAYDPSIGYFGGGGSMLVTNAWNGSVSFVSQLTPTGSAHVYYVLGVGTDPIGITYDPVYDAMIVTNSGSNNVTTFSASYGTYISTGFGVGSDPFSVACSPATVECYVANYNSDNVSVIDAYGVFTSVGVGTEPLGVTYNPATLNMWVSNYGSRNISVIGTGNTVIGTNNVPHHWEPAGMAFDAANNKMIVAIWNQATVDVF
ncbi:MAG TPA: YncE family protein [Thermoplasmata archaeon]|nr:YncE family protein [Thermoplasmata archaeon]